MALYVAEVAIAEATADQLAAIAVALTQAARRLSREGGGEAVTYLRGTFVPGSARCTCLFEAPSAAVVRRLGAIAQVPMERVEVALDLPAPVE